MSFLKDHRGAGFCRFHLRLEREEAPGPAYPRVTDEADLGRFLAQLLAAEPLEVLGLLFLDSLGRVLGHSVPFRGSISRASWEAPPIFALALLAHCRGLIVFHNHPSGSTVPSREDLEATRKLVQAAHFLQIDLRDHLIFAGPGRWVSLRRLHPQLFAQPEVARVQVVMSGPEVPRDGRSKVAPKYCDPQDPSHTWTGRGCHPRWLRAKLLAGARLEDFGIG